MSRPALPCLLSQGDAHCQQHRYDQALHLFEQALRWSRSYGHLEAEIHALQRIGHIHLVQQRPALALAITDQALALAQDRADLAARHACHRQLAHIHKHQGHFQQALHHMELAEALQNPCLQPQAHGGLPEGASLPPVLLGKVLEHLPLGVALFQQNRLVYANALFLGWVGHPWEEALGLDVSHFFNLSSTSPPGSCLRQFPPDRQDGASGCHCRRHLRHDGEAMVVDCFPLGLPAQPDPSVLLMTVRDMGEQIALTDELERIKAHYHSTPVGLCRLSPLGAPLKVNPALLALLGYPDLAACLTASPSAPDGLPSLWQTMAQGLDHYGDLNQQNLQCCRADGQALWVRVSATPIADDQGQLLYYEGVVEDMSHTMAVQTALAEMAVRDSLTQVYNRRYFTEVAQRELARARRSGHSVSVIMLDLDHFKAINDTYGHPAGDEVLRTAVRCLQTAVRQSDTLARYGGEEFVVLLPETAARQALQGAERLRRSLADYPWGHAPGPLQVTASLGIATWRPPPVSGSVRVDPFQLEALIRQADQALYQAKQQGRNRVVAYGADRSNAG